MEMSLKIPIWLGMLSLFLVARSNASVPLDENENTLAEDNSNIIHTKSGPVVGIKSKTAGDKIVNIYYGIPYAVPPVGELRFQPPRPTPSWTSTLQAVKPTNICYQDYTEDFWKVKGIRNSLPRPWSEDCLALNIWTPDPKPEGAKVVVYIYGGGFIIGSSVLYVDGTTLALDGIIVVSMNYRLGVFGFLGLGHADAPGNMGLMDQNLAMQWVKSNIEAFGGDPNDITLMGVSAGSVSVGYHQVSPMSKGLFQKSIMMSGVPIGWWGVREPEDSVAKSKGFAEKLGCPSENTTSALECLRSKHPEDILDASRPKSFFDAEHFIPTVDGSFIVEHPSVSVITGRIHPGPVIMGNTGDEGGTFMLQANPGLFETNDGRLNRKDFLQVLKKSLKGMSDLQAEALNVVYTDWSKPDDPIMLRNAGREIYADGMTNCHLNFWADNLYKSGQTVYRYVFDQKYDIVEKMCEIPKWIGTKHGSDQLPALGPESLLQHLLPAEQVFNKKFVQEIVNFVKNGDPNLSAEEYPEEPEWPKYTADQKYKVLSEKSSIHKHYKTKECAVWKKLIPILGG